MKKITLFVLAILLSFTTAKAQTDIQVVQAKGRATILNNDIAAARDEALIDARVKALETLGIHVSAETIISQSSMIDQTVVNKTKGFIRSYRVLNEFEQSGIYHVEIEAWISFEISEEDLRKYLRNFSVVVGVETQIDGRQISDTRIEDAFIGDLVDNGFDVIDKEQLLRLRNIYQDAIRGNQQAARQIGQRLLANIIIVGHANARESSIQDVNTYGGNRGQISCYRAHFSIRIIETETGSIIGTYKSPFKGIKGFGADRSRAADDAFNNGLEAAVERISEKLSEYSANKKRNVVIEIAGLPDLDTYRLIKRLIEGQRWVEGLEEREFSPTGTSSFRLQYAEKIGILAAALQRFRNLDVRSSTQSRIVLSYREN